MKCPKCGTEILNKQCLECTVLQPAPHPPANVFIDRAEEIIPASTVQGGTLIAYSLIAIIGIVPGMVLAAFLVYAEHDAWAGMALIALPTIGIMMFKLLRRFAFIVFPVTVSVITYAVFESV